jgi:hypothetical protein
VGNSPLFEEEFYDMGDSPLLEGCLLTGGGVFLNIKLAS